MCGFVHVRSTPGSATLAFGHYCWWWLFVMCECNKKPPDTKIDSTVFYEPTRFRHYLGIVPRIVCMKVDFTPCDLLIGYYGSFNCKLSRCELIYTDNWLLTNMCRKRCLSKIVSKLLFCFSHSCHVCWTTSVKTNGSQSLSSPFCGPKSFCHHYWASCQQACSSERSARALNNGAARSARALNNGAAIAVETE